MLKKSTREVSPRFLIFACLFVTCLLISNIIAGKITIILGLTLPAAVILFPVTYIFGDILTEVYGYNRARLIIWCGFAANILMAAVFMITLALPYPGFWKNQNAYQVVLGFTPRLVAASLIAYLAGEFSNSLVLSRLKLLCNGRWLWIRTIGSTLVGEGVDTLLFITISFSGVFPVPVLIGMLIGQYLWKVGYEVAATPLTYLVVGWVKRREGLDTFDYNVNYNPFKVRQQKGECRMIGENQELQDYVFKAQGLSRKGLNIMCFIGVFIFGCLLAVAFEMLGKKKQGWFYVVPIIGCLVISRQAAPALGLVAPIIYIIGWIHANSVLSGYQSSARDRIGQIDRLSGDQLTIDAILEKGILQQKVLATGEAAASTLVQALQVTGGDAQLLNLAGVALFTNKRYAEAKQFFGRALSGVKDDALIKQIKLNLTNVEKKLK